MGKTKETLEERAYKTLGPPEAPTCREKIPLEELKELLNLGYGPTACARYYKVSRQTIHNILSSARFQSLPVSLYGKETRAKKTRLKVRAIKEYREGLGGATTEEP